MENDVTVTWSNNQVTFTFNPYTDSARKFIFEQEDVDQLATLVESYDLFGSYSYEDSDGQWREVDVKDFVSAFGTISLVAVFTLDEDRRIYIQKDSVTFVHGWQGADEYSVTSSFVNQVLRSTEAMKMENVLPTTERTKVKMTFMAYSEKP